MKTLALFFALCLPCFGQSIRTITEGTTNILAIGIDSRDFEVVRFYGSGTNMLEIRLSDVVHRNPLAIAPTIRSGTVIVNNTELTKIVTFTNPMPDANYAISVMGNASTQIFATAKTVNGFQLNLTVGINGRIDYIAVEFNQ